MTIVILLVLVVAGIVIYRRHPAACRAFGAALVRHARVRLGAYDLKEVLLAAVEGIEARALPSVATTYWPNRVVIGLHPEDADRFAGLLPDIADEIGEIVATRARSRRDVTVVGGSVHVSVVRDPRARPGRPTVGARLVRADHTATVPLQAA